MTAMHTEATCPLVAFLRGLDALPVPLALRDRLRAAAAAGDDDATVRALEEMRDVLHAGTAEPVASVGAGTWTGREGFTVAAGCTRGSEIR